MSQFGCHVKIYVSSTLEVFCMIHYALSQILHFFQKPIVNQQSSRLFVSTAPAQLQVFLCQKRQIAQLHRFLQQNNESSAHQLQENTTSFIVYQTVRFDAFFIFVHQAEHTSQLPYLQRITNFDEGKWSVWPSFAYASGTLS